MRKLAITLTCAAAMNAAAQMSESTPVSIQVDLAKPQGPYTPIYSWFGYDESNYTTMKYGKLLLTELHDLSPVPVYIRAHHLLTSGNGMAELKWSSSNVFTLDANGKPVYDFTITDQTFDEFQKAGVRPMVELGFMPKDLAAAVPGVNVYQIHYPGSTISGASNNPPKDYVVWGELVRKYTEHLVQRYGKEQVSTWYFEVWNEPDIAYWHGTPEEYHKLYDYAVAGLRAALPNAIVGGPASTGPASEKASLFLDNFLKHCLNDKSAADGKPIPLDFISFHPKGRPTVVDGHVRMGLANELKAAGEGFRIVAKYPKYIHLPIILSEADPEGCAACSMKVNPSNAYRNGPLYPVYTAVAIKGLFRMAGLMSGQRVSTSSTGQVSLDDILNTGVRQAPDVDGFATKANNEAAVMLWNYHDDDVPAAGATVNLTIEGIPAGVEKVLLQHYRIDETHSNSYAAWKKMGSPQSPTPEQYAKLKDSGQLQLLSSPEWLDVSHGKVTIATSLPRQATSLMHLKW
jgi:xylan 1,4-beta-xylosidase